MHASIIKDYFKKSHTYRITIKLLLGQLFIFSVRYSVSTVTTSNLQDPYQIFSSNINQALNFCIAVKSILHHYTNEHLVFIQSHIFRLYSGSGFHAVSSSNVFYSNDQYLYSVNCRK